MGGSRRCAQALCPPSAADLVAAAAVRARVARRKTSRRLAFAAAAAASTAVADDRPLTSESDILEAVSSLYDDQLRPYGRLVRKRLAEKAAAKNQVAVDGDLSRLRRACEACQWMRVQPEDGGEWCALLAGRTQCFVDIYTGPDFYPEEMWKEIALYLETLDGDAAVLPGGRYSCALALWQLGLPCLTGRSLGEVCHIVQLAMSERKLLGYLDGTIVPYNRSQSMMKDTAAEQCVHNTAQQLPLASWSTARTCLKEVLDSAIRKGKHEVPLSNLKRLFRSRFHAELSETALGYTKISDLLQDPQLSDICSVQLLERGYVVRPRATTLPAGGVLRSRAHSLRFERKVRDNCVTSLAKSTGVSGKASSKSRPQLSPLQLPAIQRPFVASGRAPMLTPAALSKDGCIGRVVRNTFIHAMERNEVPLRRSRSLPKDMGSDRNLWETSCHVLAFMTRPVEERSSARSGDESSTDVPPSPTGTASPVWTPRLHSHDTASSFDDEGPLSPTMTASPHWSPRLQHCEVNGMFLSSAQLDSAFMLQAMGGAFAALGGAMVSYSAGSSDTHMAFDVDDCFGIPCDAGFGAPAFSAHSSSEGEHSDLLLECVTQHQEGSLDHTKQWSPRCITTGDETDNLADKIPLCLAHFV